MKFIKLLSIISLFIVSDLLAQWTPSYNQLDGVSYKFNNTNTYMSILSGKVSTELGYAMNVNGDTTNWKQRYDNLGAYTVGVSNILSYMGIDIGKVYAKNIYIVNMNELVSGILSNKNTFTVRQTFDTTFHNYIGVNGQIQVNDGSASLVGYGFTSRKNSGMYYSSANSGLTFSYGGKVAMTLSNTKLFVADSAYIGWSDTRLFRDTTGHLAYRNALLPSKFLIYDKYVGWTNNRRLEMGWRKDSTAYIGLSNSGQYGIRTLTINADTVNSSSSNIKQLYSTPATISAVDINCSLSNNFTKTLSGNSTFTFSNFVDGQVVNISVTNTNSNYLVSWTAPSGTTLKWKDGITPIQTIGIKTDLYSFIRVGSFVYGTAVQNF